MDLTALPGELAAMALGTAVDVLPVALFLLIVYRVVLKQRLANPASIAVGLGLVVLGLAFLLLGLEKALFPVGRLMVEQLVGAATPHGGAETALPWTAYYPVYAFAFCIAFTAAVAEPALLAIALRANEVSGGTVPVLGLRMAAALGVACGVTLGCVRIAAGIPLQWTLAAVYFVIVLQTLTAPRSIAPIAYDSGGAGTTAVTVPVITALGLGLAEQLPGRNPLLDGFGLIALACTFPAVTVLGYAQAAAWLEKWQARRMIAGERGAAGGKEE